MRAGTLLFGLAVQVLAFQSDSSTSSASEAAPAPSSALANATDARGRPVHTTKSGYFAAKTTTIMDSSLPFEPTTAPRTMEMLQYVVETTYPNITTLNKSNVDRFYPATVTRMARIDNVEYALTSSAQVVQGTTYIVDPLSIYEQYDPHTHRVAPTPDCERNTGAFRLFHGRGKRECMIERCMWKHMSPITISTMFPATLKDGDEECEITQAYFMQKTVLEEPHWGTTDSAGALHYPVTWSSTYTTRSQSVDGTTWTEAYPTCARKRQYPEGFDPKALMNRGVAGDPKCSDMESCHDLCTKHHGFSISEPLLTSLLIALPLVLGLPLGVLLFCCVPYWLVRRMRRNRKERQADRDAAKAANEKERRPSVMARLGRGNAGQSQDPDTAAGAGTAGGAAGSRNAAGGAGDPAAGGAGGQGGAGDGGQGGGAGQAGGAGAGQGQGSGGAGAGGANGGSGGDAKAAGGSGDAAAGGSGQGQGQSKAISDDGKGTMGRSAEEGRSRVHFDPPKPVPEGEPHVETSAGAGPPKTDGTLESASGREWADVGSMRGRKRNKDGSGQGLNLGF